jgi:hypothetical protein
LGEVIIGYRVDRDVGPVVMVAPGGTAAELHSGSALALAPITVEDARAMILSVSALRTLGGYRGAPGGDIDALAGALSALSDIARDSSSRILELEFNPLVVGLSGDGVYAVDALAVTHGGR